MSLQSKSGIAPFTILRSLWAEPIVILLLTPLLLFPGRFASLAWHPYWISFVGLFTLLQWVVHQRRWLLTPLDGCVLLILLWLPVNYWASIDKEQSWEAIGYLLFGVASYRAFIHWPPFQQRPQRLVYLFLFVTLGLTLLGPFLLLADPSFVPFLPLPQFVALTQLAAPLAETVNPNVLAGALVLLLPLHSAIILYNRLSLHQTVRITLIVLWPIMVGILMITQSRGALLAAALAVLLVVALCYSRAVWLMPIVLSLLVGGTVWVGPRQLLEMLFASSALGGLDGRIEIWDRALYALHDFPFTGIGIGTFHKVIPLLYPYFIWSSAPEIPHAHNLFLQIGVDLGLVGLVGQIALWINLFGLLVVLLRRHKTSAVGMLAAGAVGSLIAMFLHGLVDAVTWGNKLAFLPWWLYALIALLFLQEQHDTASRDDSAALAQRSGCITVK